MRSFYKVYFILFLFILSGDLFARLKKLPPQEGIPLNLGMGYSTDWESFTLGECLTGTPFYDGQNQSILDFESKIEYAELQKQLGLSAGFRYKKGFTTTSASASFLKASKSNSYSVSAVYNGSYKFKDMGLSSPTLTAIGMQLANHPERWSQTCGDYYTVAKSYGGKIFFSIRIDFKSKEAKEKFEFRFKFTSKLVDIGANIDKFKHEFSQNTEVKVSALQLGGDVTKLSNIFHGSSQVNSDDASYAFVKCSFSDFQSCQDVLKNAISYATHDFPKQFKKLEDDPLNQLRPNASLMSVTMAPYSSAGVFVGYSSQMTQQIRVTRQEMEKDFDLVLDQFQRTSSILDNIAIIKSPRQANRLTGMKVALYDHMNKMVDAAEVCLDDPLQCATEYKRVRLSSLGDPSGFHLYPENDFEIGLETYAQYCDFALSPSSTEELSNTVKHMINVAKFSDELTWNNLKNQNFSACYISEQILHDMVRLDLSFDTLSKLYTEKSTELEFEFHNLYAHKISDLSALMTFSHWKELNLADHEIASSSEFAALARLESLELRGNKLFEVIGLLNYPELRYLGLSNNQLLNVEVLIQLPQLKLVDLSNNVEIENCPMAEVNTCLMDDISGNNQLFSIHRPLPMRRWGHASITLKNGNVLVTGGAGDQKAISSELYDDYLGEFKSISSMYRNRYEHRMNLLLDGRVLITGGWSALNAAEIFDPISKKFVLISRPMQHHRADHQGVVLNNGDVLLTGGYQGTHGQFTGLDSTSSAELFEPTQERFIKIPSMKVPRAGHSMTKLPDGRVVIIGGFHPKRGLNSIELFDPVKKSFTFFRSRMVSGRGYHSAHLRPDGKIVIIGGYSEDAEAISSIELFDPYRDKIQKLPFQLNFPRGRHLSVQLDHGGIVLFGGDQKLNPALNDHSDPLAAHLSAEMLDLRIGRSSLLPDSLTFPRVDSTVVAVGRRRLLIVGGQGQVSSITAELFEY